MSRSLEGKIALVTGASRGIGAAIAEATQKGDMDRVVLGIVVMIVYVIGLNRLLWRPLFALAERKYRIN